MASSSGWVAAARRLEKLELELELPSVISISLPALLLSWLPVFRLIMDEAGSGGGL